MNDRYLYRAKRKNGGELVEGHLICSFTGIHYIVKSFDHILNQLEIYEVDRSTICQCTGLKDKNGKLIWENDIMVAHLDDEFPEDVTYERVMWHNNGFCTHQSGSVDYELIDEFDQNNFEVCGNNFDDPELLEVGE